VVANGAVDVVGAAASAGPAGIGEPPGGLAGATGVTVVGGTVVGGTVVAVTVVSVVGDTLGDSVVGGAGATDTRVRSLRPWRMTTAATLTASRITMRAVRPLRIAGFNVVLAMERPGVADRMSLRLRKMTSCAFVNYHQNLVHQNAQLVIFWSLDAIWADEKPPGVRRRKPGRTADRTGSPAGKSRPCLVEATSTPPGWTTAWITTPARSPGEPRWSPEPKSSACRKAQVTTSRRLTPD